MTDIVPYGQTVGASRDAGVVESWRLRGEERRANAAIVRRAQESYVTEVAAQLEHGRALRHQQRVSELTQAGINGASEVFDRLVDRAGGDEAKASFLIPIATAGRDAITREIR